MKNFKTMAMLLIVLALSFSLFACGDKASEQAGDEASKQESDATQEMGKDLPSEIDQADLKANYEALGDNKWELTPEELAKELGVQGTLNQERTDDWNKDADEGVEFAVYNYPNTEASAFITVLFKKTGDGDFKISSFSPVGLD